MLKNQPTSNKWFIAGMTGYCIAMLMMGFGSHFVGVCGLAVLMASVGMCGCGVLHCELEKLDDKKMDKDG